MLLYKNFCKETLDENGNLLNFELNVPDNFNFGYDVVDVMAKEAPNDTALVWENVEGDSKKFTFAEISRLSNKAANAFKKHGLKKGDTVILILKRNYEYWYIVTALHKLGIIAIPATNLLTLGDIEYRVKLANIKAAVCTGEGNIAEEFLQVAGMDNTLEKVFVCQRDIEGTINMTEEIENADDTLERVETKVDEPMLTYFTSGTTGYPKAVVHSHHYPLAHIITARYWQNVKEGGLHLSVAETGWAKASWGKIYGQWLCGTAVMAYDFENFSPSKLLKIMEKYKVTTFCAPPTVYRYFVKKDMSKYDLSSLEYLTTAGEPMNPKTFEQVYEQTGIKVMEGFGQTESTLLLANLKGTTPKPGSLGKPTPAYDVRIVDNEGNEVKTGETGEIVVYPPKDGIQYGIFTSYLADEELYKNAWRNGVYHTKDVAYKDEDGYYWYVSRNDDLIKTRGFRVGPFEVENVVMKHPAVLECAVIGVPDESRGQAIKAIIKLAAGYTADKKLAKEIKSFSNKRMASYKWIQHIEFTDEMPKTISGKIKRTDLRDNEE